MITLSDSGLTSDQYNALKEAYGDPAVNVMLEQYSLSLTSQAGGGGGAAYTNFDAIVVNDVIVRVWATANTINVETLASEDSGDQAWSSQALTATNIDTDVNLTLAESSDTVRVFWWDGTNLRYFESTDKGSSWGTSQAVGAVASVHLIAATSLTDLHYITATAKTNYRFHLYSYNGSWASTSSSIYWPFVPGSFDAIRANRVDDGSASSADILAFTTDFPPMVKLSVKNTDITRDYERVRGIAVIRQQNGRWSNHISMDVVDNLYEASEREHVRLSGYDDLLFLTYYRTDGDSVYSHGSVAISRSVTGMHWEQPYVLGALVEAPAMLLKRGAHAYIINSDDTYRSPSVGYTGDSRVTQDVTDRLLQLSARMGDIQEIQLALSNPEGALDNTSPFGDDVSLQAVIREGYVVDGTSITVQTAIVDVDDISQSLQMPTNHRVIAGRDMLARLLTIMADQVQEWESQQVSGDNFTGADDTKYSGMHHTAPMMGHWETDETKLKLSSNKTPGVALHTGVSNVWSGAVRSKIRTSATESADYAGIVFRAYDKSNLWYVIYESDSDKISIVERRNNVDSTKMITSTMGWSSDTWYALMAAFRYNQVRVYSSTDFVTFLLQMTYEAEGVSVPGAAWGDLPTMQGSMGYIGFGYSEEGTGGWPPLPAPIPWPSDPVYVPSQPDEWPTEMYVGTWEMGVYHTEDFTGTDEPLDQPTWTAVNAGLTANNDFPYTRYLMRQVILDPFDPSGCQYCQQRTSDTSYNEYGPVFRREPPGNWTEILDYTIIDSLCGTTFGQVFWITTNLSTDVTYTDYIYALVGDEGEFESLYILRSVDRGDNWTKIADVLDGHGYTVYWGGVLVVHGTTMYASFSRTSSPRIMRSTDGGATWGDSGLFGASAWIPWLASSPLNSAYVYTRSRAPIGVYDLYDWTASGVAGPSPLQNDIGHMLTDAIWFSRNLESFQRVVKDNKIYVTTNRWHTVVDSSPSTLDEPNVEIISAPIEDDEDKIILGRTAASEPVPEHIFVIDGDTETELIPKSGVDPENDLSTVSIRYTGDGLCYTGLQPVVPIA